MAVENPWVEETSGGPGTPKTPSHGVQVTWCFNSVFFFSEPLPEDEFCPVLAPDPLRERRSVWNKRKSVRIQPFFWVITKRGRTRCSSPTGLILNYKGRLRNHYKNRFKFQGEKKISSDSPLQPRVCEWSLLPKEPRGCALLCERNSLLA